MTAKDQPAGQGGGTTEANNSRERHEAQRMFDPRWWCCWLLSCEPPLVSHPGGRSAPCLPFLPLSRAHSLSLLPLTHQKSSPTHTVHRSGATRSSPASHDGYNSSHPVRPCPPAEKRTGLSLPQPHRSRRLLDLPGRLQRHAHLPSPHHHTTTVRPTLDSTSTPTHWLRWGLIFSPRPP